jgi:hypothetical protein
VTNDFFGSSEEKKIEAKMFTGRDIGYLCVKTVKEFWQMRLCDAKQCPFPDVEGLLLIFISFCDFIFYFIFYFIQVSKKQCWKRFQCFAR